MTSSQSTISIDTAAVAPGKRAKLEFQDVLKRESLEVIVVSYEPKAQMLMVARPQSHSNMVLDFSFISLQAVKSLTVLPNEPYPIVNRDVSKSVLKERFSKTLEDNRCRTNKKAKGRGQKVFDSLTVHFPQMKWDGVNIILDDLGAYIKSPYTTDDLKFPPSGNYNERTRNILNKVLQSK